LGHSGLLSPGLSHNRKLEIHMDGNGVYQALSPSIWIGMSLFKWSRLSAGSASGLSKAMWQLKIRLVSLFTLCALFLFTVQAWARLMNPPSMADVRQLAERAPLVFRGKILTVIPPERNMGLAANGESIAKIQVDRWYRGKGSAEASLRFTYFGHASTGHDCIDFRPETYWVVFAFERNGQLEMVDDCEGALTVSPLLGSNLTNADWLAQMQSDFLAGLYDDSLAARLASIQRLGGLKLRSSQDALHSVIENAQEPESKWAVYAALRSGDVSVLSRVERLLANGDSALPESAIALELQNISDSRAVVDLLNILKSSPGEITRACVLIALGDKLRDPRAVPSLADHLSDTDPYARYNAMDGLRNITHEEACTLSLGWKEADVEPQESRCAVWWEQVGKFRDWSQN
jgi:hypothetical protein